MEICAFCYDCLLNNNSLHCLKIFYMENFGNLKECSNKIHVSAKYLFPKPRNKY